MILLASIMLAATAVCPLGGEWTLDEAVSDEFSAAQLDLSKWDDWCATFQGRRAKGEFGTPCETGFLFSPKNVKVENGELVLTARFLDESEKTRENEFRRFAPYACAIVKSRKKSRYGYYEIRAKTMAACVSNAFWLYDPFSDDTAKKYKAGSVTSEIDIFEVTGKPDYRKRYDCTRIFYNTCHLLNTPYLEAVINGGAVKNPPMSFKTKTDFLFHDGYHVYGFLWTPEKMVWYLDGKPTAERHSKEFDMPLHVTFDCEVFDGWFGVPDPADLPAEFRVDYIRVYTYAHRSAEIPAKGDEMGK